MIEACVLLRPPQVHVKRCFVIRRCADIRDIVDVQLCVQRCYTAQAHYGNSAKDLGESECGIPRPDGRPDCVLHARRPATYQAASGEIMCR